MLRIAGRKSVSQMSIATTVIMISIGTTIVQPIANHNLWIAVGSAAIFIVALIILEQLQLQFNGLEKLIGGKSKTIIEDGVLQVNQMRKLRMTIDQLETQLRQQGIANIGDVKTATLEPNGLLGYELMPHARPVTLGDLEKLLGKQMPKAAQSPLFEEVRKQGNVVPVDPKLH